MAEYIEREKIYADISRLLIDKSTADLTNCEDGWTSAISEAMDVIKNAPAADVRPVVHGHWSPAANTWTHDLNEASRRIFRCSVCGRYENTKEPFCNCGAMMDGGKNNETD